MSGMQNDRHSSDREPKPETPRFEPEIIPPSRDRARPDAWVDISGGETIRARRATFRAPGPLGIILVLVALGLVASVILLLVVGFVLVWIPIVAFALAALILFGTVRSYWRRWTGKSAGRV
jgi:hypothetical protein